MQKSKHHTSSLAAVSPVFDGMITYTKPAGKLFNRMIWDFNEQTTEQWINAEGIFCCVKGQ